VSKLKLPDVAKPQDPQTAPATPATPAPEPTAQPQAPEATAPTADELPPPLAEAVESQPIIPKPEPTPQPEPVQPAREPAKPSSSKALVPVLLAGVAVLGIVAALSGKGVSDGSGAGNPGNPAPAGAGIPKGLV
jgi:hypothetical protein